MIYVIDGACTFVTGGKLAGEKRTNATNLNGTGIDGGTPRRIAKGDYISFRKTRRTRSGRQRAACDHVDSRAAYAAP